MGAPPGRAPIRDAPGVAADRPDRSFGPRGSLGAIRRCDRSCDLNAGR